MLGNLRPGELLIILAILLLLFGAKRLPDLASSMGRSLREFRRSATDAAKDEEAAATEGSRDDGPAEQDDHDR
jgi:sec-independent protein translocase protein TatA